MHLGSAPVRARHFRGSHRAAPRGGPASRGLKAPVPDRALRRLGDLRTESTEDNTHRPEDQAGRHRPPVGAPRLSSASRRRDRSPRGETMSEPLGSKITVLLGRAVITVASIAMLVGCTGSGSPTAQGTAASSHIASTGHGRIMRLQLLPIPEGPTSPVFKRGARTRERFTVPLSSAAQYIPHPLPNGPTLLSPLPSSVVGQLVPSELVCHADAQSSRRVR
jgi:hypothetical protein